MNKMQQNFVIVASIATAIMVMLLVFVLIPMNTSAIEAPAAPIKESVTIHPTMQDGHFTVVANNIGHTEGKFWVKFECYDRQGNKLDDAMVVTPSIKSGQSGKASDVIPSGTYRYEINKVVLQDGQNFYGVYFKKV